MGQHARTRSRSPARCDLASCRGTESSPHGPPRSGFELRATGFGCGDQRYEADVKTPTCVDEQTRMKRGVETCVSSAAVNTEDVESIEDEEWVGTGSSTKFRSVAATTAWIEGREDVIDKPRNCVPCSVLRVVRDVSCVCVVVRVKFASSEGVCLESIS